MQHVLAGGQMIANDNKCKHLYRSLADGNIWSIRIRLTHSYPNAEITNGVNVAYASRWTDGSNW